MATSGRVLITGASRGIGLEFVRQYVQAGWRVYATCRSPERALDLNRLAASNHEMVSVHPLDVTDPAQIESISDVLGDQALDLLINNAGVLGPKNQGFGHTDPDAWVYTFRVNAIAPLKLLEALVDNLAADGGGLVATVSSKMASVEDNDSGGYYIYRSSKTAVNAVLKSAALDLAERDITVVALHPGWVRTAMGGPDAEIDAVESVAQMRKILDDAGPADRGRFIDLDGSTIPW